MSDGEGTTARKFILAELDLEVVVKNADGVLVLTKKYNSANLSYYFGYFHAMMSSGMKEAKSKKVTLQDIDPNDFEVAVAFLIDPCSFTSLTPTSVMKVLHIYDRLDSSIGVSLVDSVVSHFLDCWDWSIHKREVRAVLKAIASEICLPKVLDRASNFLEHAIIFAVDNRDRIWSVDDLRTVQPFLEGHQECLESFKKKYCSNVRSFPAIDWSFPIWLEARIHALGYFDAINELGITANVDISKKRFILSRFNHQGCFISTDGVKRVMLAPACVYGFKESDLPNDCGILDWTIAVVNRSNNIWNRKMEFILPGSGCKVIPPSDASNWKPLRKDNEMERPKVTISGP